ncbi:methyl-accepting chemotaxis protein [Deinococcus sp. YIM 134068]|uniref:HAMP domain-containing methyl-accepting chemotaxis protein n=1 Tax=Deinococcus lichenicola TaxID=3118910 RepID=UPI002F927531
MQSRLELPTQGRVRPVKTQTSRTSWLDHMPFSRKVLLISVIPLTGLLSVGAVSLGNLREIRYNLSNIYEFMLIPIEAIGEADMRFTEVQLYTERLRDPLLTPADRASLLKALDQSNKGALEVIGRYNKEWVTTASPEFTATLRDAGKLAWQQSEVGHLSSLNAALQRSQRSLNAYVASVRAGTPDQRALTQTNQGYTQVRGDMGRLIDVNMQFADLSYGAARAADRQTTVTTLAVAGLALLLAAALSWLVVRSLTRRMSQLTAGARALEAGELGRQVPVVGRDEVGVLAGAFNRASAQLQENEANVGREREEAQRLQQNIGSFLDVTMDIASGDLTKRGQVTEDVLGNVVDSINLMVDELAEVLREVQGAAASVSGGSAAMLATTEQIAHAADTTFAATRQVSAQVGTVTGGIREVARDAQLSADAARQALAASEQGQQAVQETLGGMENIRREVQGVARRIKTLGERSLEIQDIVDTISRLSSQTNLLALNAAIEAAGAGAAGSRFAIVADEVRKLADSSAQATARIATLIKTVQLEIQEVVTSVEDGTREVEQGYRVAGTAGEQLRELGRLAQEAAAFSERIRQATGEQVRQVEQVGGAVQDIERVADESNASVAGGRQAAEDLRRLADDLGELLTRFRLSV